MIVKLPNLEIQIQLGHSSIYQMIAKGEFPAPIKLGARSVGWLQSEIDAWLEQRKVARDRALMPQAGQLQKVAQPKVAVSAIDEQPKGAWAVSTKLR